MERSQMDDAWFRQEYLCEFSATSRNMFDSDLVRQALSEDDAEEDVWDLNQVRTSLPFIQMSLGNRVFVGLDLGQKQDHSAIAVVERDDKRSAWMPTVVDRLRVRHLERLPLGTSYLRVVDRVKEVVTHPQLAGRCSLIADATGVGGPVVDLLRSARLGCPIKPVTITSGEKPHSDGERWHVPKRDLLTGLLVLLESGKISIPRALPDAPTLIRELNEVEIRHRPAGSLAMGANGAGQHDDLVIAAALACWGAGRKEISFGTRRLL
jgi:hypothetical protein